MVVWLKVGKADFFTSIHFSTDAIGVLIGWNSRINRIWTDQPSSPEVAALCSLGRYMMAYMMPTNPSTVIGGAT